jgi:crossover junction endodeoxyribonuclease RusA
MMLHFGVDGIPGAQGSKRHVGGGRLIESSKKVAPWRKAIEKAAREAMAKVDLAEPITGPVHVAVTFFFVRPRSHWRTGRNAHLLRDAAPADPTGRGVGDVDKLARAVLDALTTAGVIADDSLVIRLEARKAWALDQSGAAITVRSIVREEQAA